MSNLDVLVILNKIKSQCEVILSKALPFMEELREDNNAYVSQIRDVVPDVDHSVILQIFRNILLDIVEEANTVLREYDSFLKIVDLEDPTDEDAVTCSYLYQVWSGDTYGECEIEGLKCLLTDLKKIVVDEDTIINSVLQKLS